MDSGFIQHNTRGNIPNGLGHSIIRRKIIQFNVLCSYLTNSRLRRGFQVYREVCSACHSIKRVPYRSLVGTMATVDEMKALAEENEYDTEPNDEGEVEKRPGKLSDYIPAPYKNDEAARAARQIYP